MSVLFVTLPIALMLGALGLFACIRCIKTGQYDDLETPSLRILQEDKPIGEVALDSDTKHDKPNSH